MYFFLLHCVDDVVDLKNTAHRLSGEGNGAGGDEKRLHDILLVHARDRALAHVDAYAVFAVGVALAQIRHRRDWI